jgi:hypothetical protein
VHLPRRRADRAGADRRRDRVALDPARRLHARPGRPADPADRRGGVPRRRGPRPEAARVALAAPPARARRDDLGHGPARDRARARGVRPGPARRGPHGARGQHRRDAGAPQRAGRAGRPRPPAADLRQRHRLRLACRHRRPPHRRGAAGGGLPRRGGAPRPAAYSAHRPPHSLPGAPGRALHPADQLPGAHAALPGPAAHPRHPAADARLRPGPRGRRRAGRAGGVAQRAVQSPRDPRRPARASGPRRGRGRHPGAAGAVVAALPARPRLRQRRRQRGLQPGLRCRRATPDRRGRGRSGLLRRSSPGRGGRARGGRDAVRHRLARPLLRQPGRDAAGGGRDPRRRRRPGGLRPRRRRRSLPAPLGCARVVAAAAGVVASARAGHRRAGAGVRPPARAAGEHPARARQGRRRGGCCGSSAG